MNFDPLARIYHPLEWMAFGNVLQRARLAYVEKAENAGNILILGEGDGRFLEQLVIQSPRSHIRVIDSSGSMLRKARQRLVRKLGQVPRNVVLEKGDAVRDALGPESSFDRVVSHFFLDCFNPETVVRLARSIRRVLKPQGLWLVSDFIVPTTTSGKCLAHFWMFLLIPFFRITTRLEASRLPDWTARVGSEGFIEMGWKPWHMGMIRASIFAKAPTRLNGNSSSVSP